jgi:hypothetical protein
MARAPAALWLGEPEQHVDLSQAGVGLRKSEVLGCRNRRSE